jgi:hypothetical protein
MRNNTFYKLTNNNLDTHRFTNLDDILEKNDGLCTFGSCGLPVLLVGPTPAYALCRF